MTKRRDAKMRERESKLFAGLMRSRPLPLAPNQLPETDGYDEGGGPREQRSFAEGSSGLQELKEELLARGMSDAEAEAFLRQI